MFGYVRPFKPEMKMREFESFRGMYCGLCHTLKSRYGFGTRMILSYDMCFLAILMSGVTQCGTKTCYRRCVVSPFRKRGCVHQNIALEFAADCSMILTYWKVADTAKDEKGFRKLGALFTKLFLKGKYAKARAALPFFAEAVEQGMGQLDAIEKANTPSLDRAADAFAKMLSSAGGDIPDARIQRPVTQILYHIGRWVYIIDAWDDLEDDVESGSYNAIAARFDISSPEGKEEAREAVRLTLLQSAQTAASAAELLDLQNYDPIIKNVLYMGLAAMAESVMDGTIKQRSSRHGSI